MTAPEVVPCLRCGRPLSDPESRTRGYGPDCWRNEHGRAHDDSHDGPMQFCSNEVCKKAFELLP